MDNLTVIEKKPSLFNLFPSKLRSISFHEKLRWLQQLLYGYRVCIYLLDGKEIGYHVISNGGNPRFPFVKKQDYLLGPSFILPEYRGHNYNSQFKKIMIGRYGYNHKYYNFISHDNIASLKSTEHFGGQYLCDAKFTGFFRRLIPVNGDGDMKIFVTELEKE